MYKKIDPVVDVVQVGAATARVMRMKESVSVRCGAGFVLADSFDRFYCYIEMAMKRITVVDLLLLRHAVAPGLDRM
jgi:hypothetical protein